MMSNMLNHNKPLGQKITVYIVVYLIPPNPLSPSSRELYTICITFRGWIKGKVGIQISCIPESRDTSSCILGKIYP